MRAFAIIEGTAGIGKTTLVNRMVHAYMRDYPSLGTLLRLGQDHTYAPLDPDNVNSTLTEQDHHAYLERVYNALAFLSHPTGAPGRMACLLETLHLTLAFRPGLLPPQQILAYDQRLAELGCKLIFVKVSPETHWQRCIWERRNNGFITKYGVKYGQNLAEIHQYYVNEQERMLALFDQSRMQKLLLDGDSSVDLLTETAYQFWIN